MTGRVCEKCHGGKMICANRAASEVGKHVRAVLQRARSQQRSCLAASWPAAVAAAMGLLIPQAPAAAQSLPTGAAFRAGAGSIATAGSAMTVTQSSARGIIDWKGFSIGAGGSVTFENGAGATLNRVTGAGLSRIEGTLRGTGSVFLINPNGVVIGSHGKVVTGGSFVASSR